jgi:sialic acid synthase SpsE
MDSPGKAVAIGGKLVGDELPAYVIAEIGINHNGDLDIAKRLISVAVAAGCDAVKFQKRTIDVVYSAEELSRPRESPFGLSHTREIGKPIILSTGMSTYEQIDHAVSVLGHEDLIVMHSCSTYPALYEELNLKVIPRMRRRYGVPIGYSGHETGLSSSVAAVVLGACAVERHITLDRAMWGSDQAASLEPNGIQRLVRDIRLVEQSMGDGEKRVYEREIPIMKKLRRVDARLQSV